MFNQKRIHRYFLNGLHGRKWYATTQKHVQKIFGQDASLFIDILAVTSPNTNVKSNVSKALKAYRQFKNNEQFTGQLPIILNMLEILRYNHFSGSALAIGGAKVQAFAKALKGDFSRVVVDTWILRAFGIPNVTPLQVKNITQFCTKKARRFQMHPVEVQAAIWCEIKLASARKQSRHTEDFTAFLPFEI